MINKKLIVGTLLAITLLGGCAISMEIMGNISEQAEISEYSSGQILNSLDSSNPDIILNAKFTKDRTTVPLYDIKFEKLDTDNIKKIAESFDIKGVLEPYIKNTGEMRIVDDSYDPQRQISYYSKSGAIVYSIPDKEFPNSVEVQPVLPSKEEAIIIADEFLEKTNTYQKDAFIKNVEVNQKQQVWKSGATKPEKSYDVTTAVRYARNFDGIPVYGDEFSVIIGDGGEVVGMVKNWREVEPSGNVQLRTVENAYEDLCNQNTVYPVNLAEFDTVTINDISLGYWMEPRIYEQNKVVPIYVFSGTATRGKLTDPFIEYVYALES
ncbi:hypothetical protein [Methanoplanus limicola]|uniref:Uncharacterized protein n=1 Tax=Methanoplanus limicola DSM 2279 TaxID=937775 RepID=H1Z3G2_9EURY|nr:hypothetical protein [Methanoplanus limicola]EHQ34757.1 hypothetical protein Metlim_0632 [Methanoplanus limicola DSM 2279]